MTRTYTARRTRVAKLSATAVLVIVILGTSAGYLASAFVGGA